MALTEQQRAERRAADRDRLEAAARALLTSDGWQRWVGIRARNGLARYSLNNQLLIALQAPHATYIAGFRAFLDLGYCVRKGEKAIRVLAKRAESRLMQCEIVGVSVYRDGSGGAQSVRGRGIRPVFAG